MTLKLIWPSNSTIQERGNLRSRASVTEAIIEYGNGSESYVLYADELDPPFNEGDVIEQGLIGEWIE